MKEYNNKNSCIEIRSHSCRRLAFGLVNNHHSSLFTFSLCFSLHVVDKSIFVNTFEISGPMPKKFRTRTRMWTWRISQLGLLNLGGLSCTSYMSFSHLQTDRVAFLNAGNQIAAFPRPAFEVFLHLTSTPDGGHDVVNFPTLCFALTM